MTTQIRLSGLIPQSTTNGEGLRKVFFSQGCSHKCLDCFNKETWPFTGGKLFDIKTLVDKVVEESYLDGVTFSGGDPLQQAPAFNEFAKQLKKHNINIWSYTGYTFEELLILMEKDKDLYELLHNIDVLVDGRFEKDKLDEHLKFRGSSNQRILDLPQSLKLRKPVIIQKYV